MRRTTIVFGLAALAAAVAAGLAVASGPRGHDPMPMSMPMHASASSVLARQLAEARAATAKYATSLDAAKRAGYGIITRRMPLMGWHFMNPKIAPFDVRKPQILVYERRGSSWQLGALEWVWPSRPAKAPLPGAKYGSFPAACHFVDGTFVAAAAQSGCPATSPQTGAKFNFWHPQLVTLHVWVWYPNPSGLFASTNPLTSAFGG
jgi:hypothetical protein